MTKGLLLLLLNIPIILFSQEIKIIDTKNTPIQYAHIMINNKIGVISSSNGIAYLNKKLLPTDTLIISCIGYYDTTLAYKNITKSGLVVLKPCTYMLDEAIVIGKKLNKNIKIIGNKKHNTKFLFDDGYEIAYFVKTEHPNSKIITVSYYITKTGIPSTPFGVRLYYLDTIVKKPGKLLLDTNIVIHANNGNSWVEYTFKQPIKAPNEGFFVAMEWLPTAKRYLKEELKKGEVMVASGQCLGGKYEKKSNEIVVGRWFPIREWEYTYSTIPSIQVKLKYYE